MDHVLVTGACGLVGRAVVAELLADGRRVTATDLDTPANRALVAPYMESSRFGVVWADLTDAEAVDGLVFSTAPDAVVHLAAVIPPACYRSPRVARAVNVDAPGHLVRAAEQLPSPPRFLQASSVAVYGARNPHRDLPPLSADAPVAPSDVYGAHKVAAEALVRASSLDWAILRLGGVLTVERRRSMDSDLTYFSALLPADGRIQTVDVRDVARAFASALTADVVGETLLIGGDPATHRLLQGDIIARFTDAMGLEGGVPAGRPGDPDDDGAWFATDWMDTTRAQEALGFQRHSLPQMLDEIRSSAGWSRYLLRLLAPISHAVLERRSPYRDAPGEYADPWGAIEARWGDPGPEAG